MLFNSFEFFVFFIITTCLYFLLEHRYRWFLLLIASCIFYMYLIPVYILILFFTIIIDYFAGILLENGGKNKKLYLVISLLANIGVLAFFKYYNFFIENIGRLTHSTLLPHLSILLPIGLSFHTFQAMSYTIEVYRGNQKAERHFGIYALYVMFYPQLVAGPIERPQHILPQLHEKKYFDYENLFSGLRLILWGLFKKAVIADRLAIAVRPVFDSPAHFAGLPVILAAILFAIQIYCDFSGYSDIALGTAKIMGFKLMQNFRHPYFARNISGFWARWHISLSTWFRDYLYISLGGNRVKIYRLYFNLIFVFIISGLWHGANWTFIAWGTIHGLLLVMDKITKKHFNQVKIPAVISAGFTFIVVAIAWIFFRANSIHAALHMVCSIFKYSPGYFSVGEAGVRGLPGTYLGLPMWKFLFTLFLVPLFIFLDHMIYTKRYQRFYLLPAFARWSVYYIIIFSIVVFGVFAKNEFIYFQF